MQSRNQNLIVEIGSHIITPNGRILPPAPWTRANSLVQQFIQLLCVQFSQANVTIKDTAGTNRTAAPGTYAFKSCAAANVTNMGIIIGTGTTPVTMADHQIETQLTTNVYHSAHAFAVENPDSSTWRLAISRGFTNNTAGTVSITEAALYSFDGSGYTFCMDHTLYSVSFNVGATLTLTYRITATL